MDESMMDGLVRLAAMGTSGVCVLGIAWSGWLLKSLPEEVSQHRCDVIKGFMRMCLLVALISGASGIANTWIKQQQVSQARTKAETAQEGLEQSREQVEQLTTVAQAYQKDVELLQTRVRQLDLSRHPEVRAALEEVERRPKLEVEAIPRLQVDPSMRELQLPQRGPTGDP